MVERSCPSCKSTELQPGTVQSTGAIYFRPKNTRFMSFSTNDIRLHGNICTKCGYVMLVGDPVKAEKLTSQDAAW
ncbi:MAG: hypothetical protein ACPGXK_08900 [Phycisphaerae bacterium]